MKNDVRIGKLECISDGVSVANVTLHECAVIKLFQERYGPGGCSV
ncbi:hypothetical protein OA2633_07749 [Oceanicaulis sp. HTCC2633]|nr:hypothetical protein OA2633_07749 [Oceanicaulis sp. HTCC2633]